MVSTQFFSIFNNDKTKYCALSHEGDHQQVGEEKRLDFILLLQDSTGRD